MRQTNIHIDSCSNTPFCFPVLPPPYPVAFTPTYAPLVYLLDSDVMLHMMSIVLSRALEKRSRSFSDAQLERVRINSIAISLSLTLSILLFYINTVNNITLVDHCFVNTVNNKLYVLLYCFVNTVNNNLYVLLYCFVNTVNNKLYVYYIVL